MWSIFRAVSDTLKERRKSDLVIAPQRYSNPEEHENARVIWKDFIEVLAEHGVLFVVSAGNDGREGLTLAHGYITSLGTSQNNVVTVGGVLADGSPYMDTTPEYTGHPQGGSMSLYGPVIVDIRDYTGRFVTGANRNKGTSIGSAITVSSSFHRHYDYSSVH